MEKKSQKIVPHLWFDNQAQDAVDYYTSIFKDSSTGARTYYTRAGQQQHQKEVGSLMTVDFEIANFKMTALNGGSHFKFNPSISFFVLCSSKEEISSYWEKFSQGAEVLMPLQSYEWSVQYGWLQDKFGVNWQFMLEDPDVIQERVIPMIFFTGDRHGQSEDAMKFYTAVFGNAEIQGVLYYGSENTYAQGLIQHAQFLLEDQSFMTMDSGVENDFPFNEAISFLIYCENQEEIDYYWNKLSQGGEEQPCGWLKDKFGLSWQVVPKGINAMLERLEDAEAEKVMKAFFKMKKIDTERLKKARIS